MKNWEEDDGESIAPPLTIWPTHRPCDKLGIKLHKINFAAEYWDNVFEHFLEEYKAGRTPNPDILCNKEIKFKAFLEFAADDPAQTTLPPATMCAVPMSTAPASCCAVSTATKIRAISHTLSHQQIAQSLFPVGELEKPEVPHRRTARSDYGEEKDSTGICFIGERKFRDFLGRYLPAQPGVIETVDGEVVGEHRG